MLSLPEQYAILSVSNFTFYNLEGKEIVLDSTKRETISCSADGEPTLTIEQATFLQEFVEDFKNNNLKTEIKRAYIVKDVYTAQAYEVFEMINIHKINNVDFCLEKNNFAICNIVISLKDIKIIDVVKWNRLYEEVGNVTIVEQ